MVSNSMELAGSQSKTKYWSWIVAAAAIAIVVGLYFFFSKGRAQATPTADQTASRGVQTEDGRKLVYSKEFADRTGIKVAPAETTAVAPTLAVVGTVTFDPSAMAAVGTRITGRVRAIRKMEGDSVKPGDVLAEIESAELGQAQAQVSALRAQVEATNANEKREEQLAEARVSARREAEAAKAEAASTRAELKAAEQKVRALGGTLNSEIGVLTLTTPIGGRVVERHVSRGQSVDATHTAYRIADLGHLWIELAVFEREIHSIRVGDEVEVSPQTDRTRVVRGKVAYVGDIIDRETRSAPVRVRAENADGSLRPGQSVIAKIHASSAIKPALVVPRDAVTEVDGKPVVFVSTGQNAVEPRPIEVGAKDATRVEILSGLNPGEQVVIAGVFALKSELFR